MNGFAFVSPFLLAALAVLPLIWLILRQSPPPPRTAKLPSMKLLSPEDIPPPQAARPPWWLLLLRLFIAALIIAALAGPRWQPPLSGDVPQRLTIVMDNGWAATRWPEIRAAALARIDALEPAGTRFAVIGTAARPSDDPQGRSRFVDADTARAQIGALNPVPWQLDRAGAAEKIDAGAALLWLADGVETEDAAALRQAVPGAEIDLFPTSAPAILTAGQTDGGWAARLARPAGAASDSSFSALTSSGGNIASDRPVFEGGRASVRLSIAPSRRNDVARLSAGGGAAATYLTSGARVRPRVVVIDGSSDTPPLESGDFYIRRALEPHADIARADLSSAAEDDASLFFLSDIAATDSSAAALLARVEAGAVSISFAGPRMAENGSALSPVQLRSGARAMGGVMTWQEPQTVGAFMSGTPLAGLPTPDDATVSKQLLSRGADDEAAIWATLADGTPLVSAKRRGDGLLILVHSSADPGWSDLPLSGLFESMIVRMLPLASDSAALDIAAEAPWQLERELMANATLGEPALPISIAPADWEGAKAGPDTPPGIYRSGEARRALNMTSLIGSGYRFRALDTDGLRPAQDVAAPVELGRWLMLAALILLAFDIFVTLGLRGALPRVNRAATAAASILVASLLLPTSPASAQQAPTPPPSQIAYVGGTSADAQVAAGLTSLALALRRRTSVDPGEPQRIDPAAPGIGRYPLLYWPAYARTRMSAAEAANLRSYLARGGLILFDFGRPLGADSGARALLSPLGLPALAEADSAHVLFKSYYLLNDVSGGALWVEGGTGGDSGQVSGVAIGGGNWPELWAASTAAPPSEREAAIRFGINLMMYALTGTYKADQVHAETLLGRIAE
ncbi:MAG: DUF4159 domain-containing protein [Pacificimonas sp.]